MRLEELEKAKAGEEIEVYLAQSLEYGFLHVLDHESDRCITLAKGKAVFDFLDNEKVVDQGLTAIDREIKEIRAKAEVEINRLKDRKADFLSLQHIKAE